MDLAGRLICMGVTDDRKKLDTTIDPVTGQQKDYLVMEGSESGGLYEPERPVYTKYVHDKCGTVTTIGERIARTYALNPKFYSATFCVGCKNHYPVSEFTWLNAADQRAGTVGE